MKTYYELDHENFLVRIGGDWDDFAKANKCEGAISQHILSRPIWDFVDGDETASFLNAIFFWCRRKTAEFVTKYRCDSELEKRLFSMRVTPTGNGSLRVASELLSTDQRVLPAGPSIVQTVPEARCSMCCHFKINGQWIDPFTTPCTRLFTSSHVICPNCKAAAWQAMGEASVSRPDMRALFKSA